MTLKEVVISQGLAIWSQAVLEKVVIISLDQTKKHEFNIRTFTPWHCLTTLVIIIEFFQNGVIILVDQKNGSISEHSHPIIVGEFPKQLYFAKCFRTTDFK